MRKTGLIAALGVLAFTSTASAQQPCVADARQVVDHVYRQVLERPADSGSASLMQALDSGRITVRDAVAEVALSPEYETRFFWPPIVTMLYREVLGRQPSAPEVRDMSAELAGGTAPAALVAHLATRAVNNDPQAIRMLYRRLLHRDPDPEGMRAYTELAQREGAAAVAHSIVSSPEYRQNATANGIPLGLEVYEPSIRMLYRHLLGRDADRAGLIAMSELASVYGAKGPIDRILRSPEYQQRFGAQGLPGTRDARFCEVAPHAVPRSPRAMRRWPR